MPAACKPANEVERLGTLKSYAILDTLPEKEYDQITELAANICKTPISLVSLVDADRQWFKSKVGLDATATSRDIAFCAHAILKPEEPLIVNDATKDERFKDNELVVNAPNIRFYAGIPLNSPSGYPLGTLCVIDKVPRELQPDQIDALKILANNVVSILELRKARLNQAQLIRKLSDSNSELEQFAYVASHDLQEPIRMVGSYVALLKKRYGEKLDADADRFINYTVEGCNRMHDLVNGLLEFSRVESSEENKEIVNCNDIVKRVMYDLEVKINKSGAIINYDKLPAVLAVPSQLQVVFRNLINNAIKYCVDRVPEINISVKNDDAFIKFSVKDNGIGIEEQYQEKIFQIFKRLHTRNEFSGTGIGLTITKKIINKHGGEISLESIPGEGSTFHFTLPAESNLAEILIKKKVV